MKKKYINALLIKAHNYKVHSSTKMSAKESFLRTEKELKRLNSTVRSKIITNEHIGNSVFKNLRGEFDEDTIKVFVNDHFTAGYYSFL